MCSRSDMRPLGPRPGHSSAEHVQVWLHLNEVLAVGLQQVPVPSRILRDSHLFRNYLLKKI